MLIVEVDEDEVLELVDDEVEDEVLDEVEELVEVEVEDEVEELEVVVVVPPENMLAYSIIAISESPKNILKTITHAANPPGHRPAAS